MYTLQFDEQRRLLTQKASGFWDMAEVDRYGHDMSVMVTKLRAEGKPFTMLFDSSELPVQSIEVMQALAEMSGTEIMQPAGRVAVLVSGVLNKLQAERVKNNPLIKVFLDREEALLWLAEPVDGAGTAVEAAEG